MRDNLKLWKEYRTPHSDSLKNFNRRGFRGSAIDPMWLIRCATELWGPMGDKWGIIPNSVTDEFVNMSDGEILHFSRFNLYYPSPVDGEGVIPCVGQTYLVMKTKDGLRSDEEAPKKSMTDGLSKGLSWLGFASDIYMGMFDGNKYGDLDGPSPAYQKQEANGEKLEAGTMQVVPQYTSVAKKTDDWTMYELGTDKGIFLTFEQLVAETCELAISENKSVRITLVENKGRFKVTEAEVV